MRKFIYIFIALALAACSMGNPSELERNQQKWQDSGISHYRFSLFIGCFCVFSQDMPLNIEVQDGKVVSMEYQSGKTIEEGNRELFRRYETIDQIFSELEKDINGEADDVVVAYESKYGYPAQVNIDFVKDATDDEITLNISAFEKLP
jgi:Family of unknown function (DUF6174)